MAVAAPIAVLALATALAFLLWTIARSRRPVALAPSSRMAVLVTVVVVPSAFVAYLIRTSGFVWDDIENLRQAQVGRLSIGYLGEPTSGHFAPGHRLIDWVFQHLFSFNFDAAVAVMVTGFALTLLLFHRILAEQFRPGAGPLLLTLVYGVSLVHVGVTQWWASGMDRVPATILSFAAILCYLLYHRTRSWPFLATSLVSVGLAQLFYVKPIFVPLYLVLIRVLLLDPGRRVRESLADAAREWWVWLLYGAPVGTFSILYLRAYPKGLSLATTPSIFLEYLSTLWFRVLVPNFFGLWIGDGPASASTWAGAAVAQLLLVALVAWSIWRWRLAWRAWAFFAVGFVANAAIVGVTRVGLHGAQHVAYSVYYNLEAQFLFVMALGAAFLRPRSASPVASQAAPPPLVASPLGYAALGVAIAMYAGLSWSGAYRISQPQEWIGARSRLYLDRASEGIRALRRTGAPFALVDGVVPYDVVPYALVPYNNGSEVFPLIDTGVVFDPTGRALYDVGSDGVVRPVAFAAETGGDAGSLLQRQLIGVLGATPRIEGGALCVTAGPTPATVGIVSPTALSGDGLSLRLRFDARTDAVVSLVVDPRPVQQTGVAVGLPKFRVLDVKRGEGQTKVFALDAPEVRGVYLVASPGSELCVETAELGRLVDRP